MIALEKLFDNSIASRNFDRLVQAVADFGPDPTTGAPRAVGIRFGVATLTWPGATQFSNGLSVTHGLGRTPIGVLVSGNLGVLSGVAAWTGTPGATTFTVQGWNPAGAPGAGATDKVFWVAIG